MRNFFITIFSFFSIIQSIEGQFFIDNIVPKFNSECMQRCVYVKDALKAESIKIEFFPSEYRFVKENIMVCPTYSYFSLKSKVSAKPLTRDERVIIEPPIVQSIRQRKEILDKREIQIESIKPCLGLLHAQANTCLRLCNIEIPSESVFYDSIIVVIPAKIVRKRPDTTIIEVLQDTSDLLFEVKLPPQYVVIEKPIKVKEAHYRISASFDLKDALSNWQMSYCDVGIEKPLILKVQQALNQLGYKVAADNVFGKKTKAALRAFQKDKGLPIGKLDLKTLKAMGITLK